MKKLISIFLGVVCLVGACANNENGATVPEKNTTAVTQSEAVKLAQRHLSLKNWTWGEPQDVTEQEGKFLLSYETPERELRLIGARVLVVDKDTRVVSIKKRR